VFEKIRLAKLVTHFARDRLPLYGPLVAEDLRRFRDEIVKATVGVAVSAVAGLLFCCFLSVAVIVSNWDGPHRNLAAWLICASWGVLALLGLCIARRALAGPLPFRFVAHELSRDYELLIEELEVLKDPEHAQSR
jgi:hypothetical protein